MRNVAAKPLKILQLSPSSGQGGAEAVALSLHHHYRDQGCASWLAVGRAEDRLAGVIEIPNDQRRHAWARWCLTAAHRHEPARSSLPRRILKFLAEPIRRMRTVFGHEDFHFPASRKILNLPPERPDILQAHNLHGSFFDLRALPFLSGQVPVFLTLHDAWLLSGHCAHSFECERWKLGCGNCPDLGIYPPIRRDATAYNWRRKQAIYRRSHLHVATPCRWLMEKVERSMLLPAVREKRVIPNGIDPTTFRPNDKAHARETLGIRLHASVLLYTGRGIRESVWRDYGMLRNSLGRLSHHDELDDVLFIAVGEAGPEDRVGKIPIHFVPYQSDSAVLAKYYQAADVYVHPARADTFPTSILEALACGTPVVATEVGGIPEQVNSLSNHTPAEATGILTPAGSAESLAEALARLLGDSRLRASLSANAATDARRRFTIDRQGQSYLDWFGEILESKPTR